LETPTVIDEAKVILTNILTGEHIQTDFTTHNADGFEHLNLLAICQYEEDPGYYLFYCDSNWKVLNDTYHDTKELAIEQAELEFKGTAGTWANR